MSRFVGVVLSKVDTMVDLLWVGQHEALSVILPKKPMGEKK